MAATSSTAARLAVINALTTATGQPQALSSLFMRSTPTSRGERAITAKTQKRCFVMFSEWADDDDLAPGSVITRKYVVRIIASYSAGSDLFSAEDERALLAIEADEVAIPNALCEPGVLLVSPASAPTGLSGACLERSGYRGQIDPPRNEGGETPRVYRVTHLFPNVSIDIARPS
jgi:hypothetical protein